MSAKKAVEVVSNTLSVELESTRQFIREYSYQHGHYSPIVFNFGGMEYYAVGKRKPTSDFEGEWVLHKDQFFAEKYGTTLWVVVSGSSL